MSLLAAVNTSSPVRLHDHRELVIFYIEARSEDIEVSRMRQSRGNAVPLHEKNLEGELSILGSRDYKGNLPCPQETSKLPARPGE